jgi:hypothetical protein
MPALARTVVSMLAVAFALGATTAVIAVAADGTILGTAGADRLTGTAGADALYGRAGNDVLDGGEGDDELDGGPGADVLRGGPGVDVVSYAGAAPVIVTLDGAADDGTAGERDDVQADVEDVFGGAGDDRLTGNGDANTLDGGAGDDALDGGAGADVLLGGDGDDVIVAADGAVDQVDCGDGDDTATVDKVDVTVGCEHATGERATAPAQGAVPRFLPQFVTQAALRGPALGRLRGVSALEEVPAGATVDVLCVRACTGHRSFRIRKRLLHRQKLELTAPVTVTKATIVEVRVRRTGWKGRSGRFTFAISGGVLLGHRIASGCVTSDAAARSISCRSTGGASVAR